MATVYRDMKKKSVNSCLEDNENYIKVVSFIRHLILTEVIITYPNIFRRTIDQPNERRFLDIYEGIVVTRVVRSAMEVEVRTDFN